MNINQWGGVMNAQWLHQECLAAAQRCPQFDEPELELVGGRTIDFSQLGAGPVLAAINYWRDTNTLGGSVLWVSGYADGGFPSWLYPDIPDREDESEAFAKLARALHVSEDDLENSDEIEFSWVDHVMPLIAEGEVLVIQEVGAEKLRYLTGCAEAFMRRGEDVSHTCISLNHIYDKAANEFGVERTQISAASY